MVQRRLGEEHPLQQSQESSGLQPRRAPGTHGPQNCEQGANVPASQLILRNVKQMFSGLRRSSAHVMATVTVTHMEFFPVSALFCISRSECITLLPPPREGLI